MAKKVNAILNAELTKNPEKGGAWLARVSISDEGMDTANTFITAWSNASACKRWVKEMVQKHTPKKSIKFVVHSTVDEKGKPNLITGVLNYKREI